LSDLLGIRDRVILVTGASSGLGRHFAEMLARRGAKVVAVARRTERLDELAHTLAGTSFLALSADVTDAAAMTRVLDQAEAAVGTIEVLVNNAGITLPGPVAELPREDWRRVIDTNLNAAWMIAQEVARRLIAAKKPGSIVNIASIAGIRTMGLVSPYVASKAGLIALTKNMAVELAPHGIRVNAIAPGLFDSELGNNYARRNPERRAKMRERIPMGRVGRHDELDAPLLLLASDAGSYMTGSVVVVDGGFSEIGLTA